MLKNSETPTTPDQATHAFDDRRVPTAGTGAAAAARAVSRVVLAIGALAFVVLAGLALSDGSPELIVIVPVWVSIVAAVVLLFALPVAMVLGALLARFHITGAAVALAPVAGFLVPFAMFQDATLAGGCATVSIAVGILFAGDARFAE